MKDPRSIVKELQVTEKGTELGERQNKYLFRVDRAANKIEIRRAVEQLFKVSVTNVNTLRYRGKRKRERTVSYGKRSDWKRAVVTLKRGDKIDVV
jgi:large subunit ribosomal protein L23